MLAAWADRRARLNRQFADSAPQLLPFGAHFFWVPAPEDRVILSTLQRMYRHFYLRLCDVADTAQLLENSAIDYFTCVLRRRPQASGKALQPFLELSPITLSTIEPQVSVSPSSSDQWLNSAVSS